MKILFSRPIGVMLVIAAIFGMAASVIGLYFTWTNIPQMETSIVSGTALLHDTISATDDLLTVVGDTLDNTYEIVSAIEKTMTDLANTVQNTADATRSVGGLVGENIAGVIAQTQESISSAAKSIQLVDNFLRLASKIPFIGLDYSPEAPLGQRFEEIGTSLTSVPDTLAKVQTDMADTSTNLSVVKTDVEELSTAISGIKTNLEDAQKVIADYHAILAQLDASLTSLEENLPAILNVLAAAITALLIWLMFTQIAMLVQGFEMLDRAASRKENEDKTSVKLQETQEIRGVESIPEVTAEKLQEPDRGFLGGIRTGKPASTPGLAISTSIPGWFSIRESG